MINKSNHLIIIISSILGILLLTATIYLYYQDQSLKKQPVNQQISPTFETPSPTPKTVSSISIPPDETVNWKLFTNNTSSYSLKYPPLWRLDEFKNENRISLSDDKNNLQLINNLKSPKSFTTIPEQIIGDWISYYLNSTSQFETGGKISNKESVKIGGIQGTEYVVEENKPTDKNTSKRSWIFIINNDKVIYLDIEGPDSKIFDQILSTFKFLNTNELPNLSEENLTKGWYWGSEDQKKPGTPDNWVYQEAGRSSCWHKPGTDCFGNTY